MVSLASLDNGAYLQRPDDTRASCFLLGPLRVGFCSPAPPAVRSPTGRFPSLQPQAYSRSRSQALPPSRCSSGCQVSVQTLSVLPRLAPSSEFQCPQMTCLQSRRPCAHWPEGRGLPMWGLLKYSSCWLSECVDSEDSEDRLFSSENTHIHIFVLKWHQKHGICPLMAFHHVPNLPQTSSLPHPNPKFSQVCFLGHCFVLVLGTFLRALQRVSDFNQGTTEREGLFLLLSHGSLL